MRVYTVGVSARQLRIVKKPVHVCMCLCGTRLLRPCFDYILQLSRDY
jgi:hypothetical protein